MKVYSNRPTYQAKRTRGLCRLFKRDELPRCTCGHTAGTHRQSGTCKQCDCDRFELVDLRAI